MRRLSGALALTLALACIYRGAALDVGRRARPDATNREDGLQVLFPRPGVSLCDEDQLELVAIYNGSPFLPESHFAVLEIEGHVASELYSGVLSARLPLVHGGNAVNVEMKLTIRKRDGNVVDTEAMTLYVDTAAGCGARTERTGLPDGGALAWMTVGFHHSDTSSNAAVESLKPWIAPIELSGRQLDMDAALQLGKGAALLVLINGRERTVAHTLDVLLRYRRRAAPQYTGMLLFVHLDDIYGSAQKHFYAEADLVLTTACRGAAARANEVCVPAGLDRLPIQVNQGMESGGRTQWEAGLVASPEYVWAMLGGADEMPARQAVVQHAMRYSHAGLLLEPPPPLPPYPHGGASEKHVPGAGAEAEAAWVEELRSVVGNAMTVVVERCDVAGMHLMYEALQAGALPLMDCPNLLSRLFGPDHKIALLHVTPPPAAPRAHAHTRAHLHQPAAEHAAAPGGVAGGLAADDWLQHLHRALGPPALVPRKRAACHAWWASYRLHLRAQFHAALTHAGLTAAPSTPLPPPHVAAIARDKGARHQAAGTAHAAAAGHSPLSGRAASLGAAGGGQGHERRNDRMGVREGGGESMLHSGMRHGTAHESAGHVSGGGSSGGGDMSAKRSGAGGGEGVGGGGGGGRLSEWAQSTRVGISRRHPPHTPHPPHPPHPRSHAPTPQAPAPSFPWPRIQQGEASGGGEAGEQRLGEGGRGGSGWRFEWQAGRSACNRYPKWHSALCDDGGMSVEDCGTECVHVTPLHLASLSPEPDQRRDLEAAAMAAHQQAIFGQAGPEAFGWANPHPHARVAPSQHSLPQIQGSSSKSSASMPSSTPRPPNLQPAPPSKVPASASASASASADAAPNLDGRKSSGGGGEMAREIEASREASIGGIEGSLARGGWDQWWEAGGDGGGGHAEELWRGTEAGASGARVGGGWARLRIVRPRQGEHVVCAGPGCSVPLEFGVEGGGGGGEEVAVSPGEVSASARLKFNGQEAATFEDARSVKTGMVDVAVGWHVLELHVSAARPGGGQLDLADARSLRVVHVLTSPRRGAVSFGTRGGCRMVWQAEEEAAGAIVCVVRPMGWAAEYGWEEEEVTRIEVGRQAQDVYAAAVEVAELFELGRIEALQIWQCLDAFQTHCNPTHTHLPRTHLPPTHLPRSAPREHARPASAASPPQARWAVIAANGNSDYAFYLPVVAYIWLHVMRFRPLVMLVGAGWRAPASGSRLEIVARALQDLGDEVKVEVIASEEGFNTAAVAQVGRLYACLVEGITDDDYLLTTDADLIPLSRDHFLSERNWNRSLHLYNSFCCAPLHLPDGGLDLASHTCSAVTLGAPDVQRGAGVHADHRLLHLPISYAGARAGVWRDIMQLPREEEDKLRRAGVGDVLRRAVEARLLNDLGAERAQTNLAENHRHADMDMWHLDQRVLSTKVAAWAGFPHATEMTPRYGHSDRVDRMRWEVPVSLGGYVDAHLPQPGFSDANWAATRPLLQLVADLVPARAAAMMAWMDDYRDAFLRGHDTD